MDVVLLGAGRPARGTQPAALKKIGMQTSALDWQIQSISACVQHPTIHYLGGYHVEDVVAAYPQLNFSVVPDWDRHGALHTLMHAPFSMTGNRAMLVSYSDTIFRERELSSFLQANADVIIGVDSNWRDRFKDRPQSDIDIAETLQLEDFSDGACGEVEFTGLMRFNGDVVQYLAGMPESAAGSNLLQLIKHLKDRGYGVQLHDFNGEWAEFNSPDDVARFVLGTKAETLARLKPLVNASQIGHQISFTTQDWRRDPGAIVSLLRREFDGESLVIRSSAQLEDSWTASNAGGFESRLNVDGSDHSALSEAVDAVIDSYGQDATIEDQVLVQPFVSNVKSAGVVFTCSLETGAPYYKFNFDDRSRSTDSVTSGASNGLRTIIVSRSRSEHLEDLEPGLIPVLKAIQELERLLGFSKLDIEFAVDQQDQVHIFQVRPITVEHAFFEVSEEDYESVLHANVDYFVASLARRPFAAGERTMFGNMPDWNPAEIIGTRPKPLAFSLYRELITDEVWAHQRSEFGYRDVRPHPLIVAFGGQPYVDLRASLNSFIPAELPEQLAEKLVNAYLSILDARPELHDKLEFDVAFTIWTPSFSTEAKERFGPYGITNDEIELLGQGLKRVTQGALTRLARDVAPVREMARRSGMVDHVGLRPIERVFALLDDCRRFGTLAFSHAARAGFVAGTFLRSFVATQLFTEPRRQEFMNSVSTVAKEFERRKHDYFSGHLKEDELIAQFGHLRPGTYEVEKQAYWEDPEKYLLNAVEAPDPSDGFHLLPSERQAMFEVLEDLGSDLTPEALVDYMRTAIEARESVKFDFTRNLSQALDACVLLADDLAVKRSDLSYLEFSDLANYRSNLVTAPQLRATIAENRQRYVLTQLMELPPLITRPTDFYCFERHASQPNFVTNGDVEAELVLIEEEPNVDPAAKIVLIPRADPGYDWLFGSGIVGLITMYGGANSHMAIRSAELGLPAVIGVGEKRYEELSCLRRVQIDCANQIIREIQ